MTTKFFKVGAYLPPGALAYLADADTVYPCYQSHGGLIFTVKDVLLAGEICAVDYLDWSQSSPAPPSELRAITDEEKLLIDATE